MSPFRPQRPLFAGASMVRTMRRTRKCGVQPVDPGAPRRQPSGPEPDPTFGRSTTSNPELRGTAAGKQWSRRFESQRLVLQSCVVLSDRSCFLRFETFQKRQYRCRIERIHIVISLRRAYICWSSDKNDWDARSHFLQRLAKFDGRDICYPGVKNDAVNRGKDRQRLDGFGSRIRGDHIKLGRLNDELPGGNRSRVFFVNDQETRSNHRSSIIRLQFGSGKFF